MKYSPHRRKFDDAKAYNWPTFFAKLSYLKCCEIKTAFVMQHEVYNGMSVCKTDFATIIEKFCTLYINDMNTLNFLWQIFYEKKLKVWKTCYIWKRGSNARKGYTLRVIASTVIPLNSAQFCAIPHISAQFCTAEFQLETLIWSQDYDF